MNLKEADLIFGKVFKENFDFNGSSIILLQKFLLLWSDEAVKHHLFYKYLRRWYSSFFEYYNDGIRNDTSCLIAIFLLEILITKANVDMNQNILTLLQETLIPLQKIIISHYLDSCNTSVNCEVIIAFYRTHKELSMKVNSRELIQKYNLWKPILLFYLKNDKFNLLIQNTSTDYINNLLSVDSENKLCLLLEIISVISKSIKLTLQNEYLNDRILIRSLRLLNCLLVNHILNLNSNSFSLVSLRCHSLIDYTLEISLKCDDQETIKYALNIHILLKCYVLETSENINFDLIFNNFILFLQNLILLNSKYLRLIPELFHLFSVVFKDSDWIIYQHYVWFIRIVTCTVYLKKLFVSINDIVEEEISMTYEFKRFLHFYKNKLLYDEQLPSIVSDILRSISGTDLQIYLNKDKYCICSLHSILRNFINYKNPLSSELCDMLLKIVHAVSTVISVLQISPINNSFEQLLFTAIELDQLNLEHKTVIRLAIFRLCQILLKKIIRFSDTLVNSIKNMILKGLRDSCWEIRDSVLELFSEILDHFSSSEKDLIMTDEYLCTQYLNSLTDEESFVRTTSYSVLLKMMSKSNDNLRQYFNTEKLLAETVENYSKETESSVRRNMIIFIIHVWQQLQHEISDLSLLTDLYKTIYEASRNDPHSEVRIQGILFWEYLVQIVVNHIQYNTKKDIIDILLKLSSIGCLKAIVDAIEDEYDVEVTEVALTALKNLRSLNLGIEDIDSLESNITIDNKEFELKENSKSKFTSLLCNILNQVTVSNTISAIIEVKDFITIYGQVEYKNILKEYSNQNIISFAMEDLLNCFQECSISSEINQKDCY